VTDQTTHLVPQPQQRFDAYQVQPVVETTAPDGIERNYELFPTLADAQKEVEQFRSKGSIEGVENQAVLWSLYGLRKGIAEHLADRISETDAFVLLYAVSGITGVSGQTHYPLPDLWAVVHTHRHGTDVRFATAAREPTEAQVVRCLEIDFEPQRDELIEIHHVDEIKTLDWQEADDEPMPKGESNED
jgi:hypothetical protein